VPSAISIDAELMSGFSSSKIIVVSPIWISPPGESGTEDLTAIPLYRVPFAEPRS
jgi:hypothetical protein